MLSESWLKDQHPCFVYVSVHIRDNGSLRRRLMMIKAKNHITLIVDAQIEDSQKNLNINLNIRVLIPHI